MQLVILSKTQKNSLTQTFKANKEIGYISTETLEEALGMVEMLPDTDAILFDDSFLEEVIQLISIQEQATIDYVYIGNKELSLKKINLHKVESAEQLVTFLETGLKVSPVISSEKSNYSRISALILNTLEVFPVDFYIRLKRSEGFNYIKYFNANAPLEMKKLEEHKQKGLTDYYILKDDLQSLNEKLNLHFKQIITQVENQGSKVSKDVVAQIFTTLNTVGLSEKSCTVAYKTIENLIKNSPTDLLKEMNEIFKNKNSYKFKKSLMCSTILINFSKKIEWITPQNIESLNLCAFFSDRFLQEDEMVQIRTEYELTTSMYQDSAEKLINEHALKASNWISQFDKIPNETSRLIKQHHGSISGVGFPNELSDKITKLSLLFILVESFSSNLLLAGGGKFNIPQELKKIKGLSQNKKFHELIDSFLTFLKEQ